MYVPSGVNSLLFTVYTSGIPITKLGTSFNSNYVETTLSDDLNILKDYLKTCILSQTPPRTTRYNFT